MPPRLTAIHTRGRTAHQVTSTTAAHTTSTSATRLQAPPPRTLPSNPPGIVRLHGRARAPVRVIEVPDSPSPPAAANLSNHSLSQMLDATHRLSPPVRGARVMQTMRREGGLHVPRRGLRMMQSHAIPPGRILQTSRAETRGFHITRPPPAIRPSSAEADPVIIKSVDALSALTSQLRILQQRSSAARAAMAMSADANGDAGHGPSSSAAGVAAAPVAESCVICFEMLTSPESVITMCGHVFHHHCLLNCPGIDRGAIPCPICRRSVQGGELIQIVNGLPQGDSPPIASTNPHAATTHGGLGANMQILPAVVHDVDDGIDVLDLVSDAEDEDDDDITIAEVGRRRRSSSSKSENDIIDITALDDKADDKGKDCRDVGLAIDKEVLKTLQLVQTTCMNAVSELKEAKEREFDSYEKFKRREARKNEDIRKTAIEERQKLNTKRGELDRELVIAQQRSENTKAKQDELTELIAEQKQVISVFHIDKKQLELERKALEEMKIEVVEKEHELRKRELRLNELAEAVKRNRGEKRARDDGDAAEVAGSGGALRASATVKARNEESDEGCVMEDAERTLRAMKSKRLRASSDDGDGSIATGADGNIEPLAAFGDETMHRPSLLNRPAPPRMGRAKGTGASASGSRGLGTFAAKRAAVQRPVGSIGKKNSVRRKT